LALLKLFKLTLQSYVKRMKKVNFYKKISLFRHAGISFDSHFHKFRSYCNSIGELKPNKQRWGMMVK